MRSYQENTVLINTKIDILRRNSERQHLKGRMTIDLICGSTQTSFSPAPPFPITTTVQKFEEERSHRVTSMDNASISACSFVSPLRSLG